MPEASEIGWTVAILVPCMGALLYIIRAEIRKNTRSTEATEAQMIPNHGTSLRDAVDRIEKRMTEIHIDVRNVDGKLDRHLEHHIDSKE